MAVFFLYSKIYLKIPFFFFVILDRFVNFGKVLTGSQNMVAYSVSGIALLVSFFDT